MRSHAYKSVRHLETAVCRGGQALQAGARRAGQGTLIGVQGRGPRPILAHLRRRTGPKAVASGRESTCWIACERQAGSWFVLAAGIREYVGPK
jgi:hypothetical protein